MLRCVALIDFEHPMKPCPRYFSWQPKSTKCTTGDCKLETSHTNPPQQSATDYTLHVLLAGFGGCEIGLQTRVSSSSKSFLRSYGARHRSSVSPRFPLEQVDDYGNPERDRPMQIMPSTHETVDQVRGGWGSLKYVKAATDQSPCA